ncbi:MAG TPA: hypothetical protein VJ824_03410 [Bacillota bacterium]|nr:hypothetical protein [Bacillota bacterium]
MDHLCDKCGIPRADKYSAFELDSWGFVSHLGEKKEFYYLCFPCFDELTNVYTEEVQDRLEKNRKELDRLIAEGKVCPKCKTPKLEIPHICP